MNELPFGTTRCPKCQGINYSGMPICSSCTSAEANERRAAARNAQPARKAWSQMTRKERLSVELASIRRPSYNDDDANGGNGTVLEDAARNSSLR